MRSGSSMRLVPPTRAWRISPLRMALQASWTATRLPEHAVSNVILGPLKLKKYEIRLAASATPVPVNR